MYEEMTLRRIDELSEFIEKELTEIRNTDVDISKTTSKLMYKILMFSVENNGLNEHILHNECWKYWEIVQDEFMDQIP